MLYFQPLGLRRFPLSAIPARHHTTSPRRCDNDSLRAQTRPIHLPHRKPSPKSSKQKQKKLPSTLNLIRPKGMRPVTLIPVPVDPVMRETKQKQEAEQELEEETEQDGNQKSESFNQKPIIPIKEPFWATVAASCGLGRWETFRWNKPGQYVFERAREVGRYPDGRPAEELQLIDESCDGLQGMAARAKATLYWKAAWEEIYDKRPEGQRLNGKKPLALSVHTHSSWNDCGASISADGIVFSRHHPLGRELLRVMNSSSVEEPLHRPVLVEGFERSPWPIERVPETGRLRLRILELARAYQLAAVNRRPFDRRVLDHIEPFVLPSSHPIVQLGTAIVDKVALANKLEGFKYDLYIVNCPNWSFGQSFAGGEIVLSTACISEYHNEAGFAWLIAHEMAHFTVSHSLERLSYTIRWKDLLLWIWPLSWLIGAAASKLGCQDILQNAACSWHRWQTEFEADHLSELWTARAGYSTLEALNSFRSMMKSRDEGTIRLLGKEGSKGGQELIPKFLETHPWMRKRLRRMELLIPEIQKQTIIGTKGGRDMKRLIESTTGDFRKISSDEKGGAILKAAGIM